MYHLCIKIAFTLQKADWRIHGQKLLFNDALSSLIEFAAANANHVSTEDIHTFLQ
mgnify:CR=1 FL=1